MTAQIIPFPATPVRQDALGYWFSGGDIFLNANGRGVHMDPWQAEAARSFWQRQAADLHYLPTTPEARIAARRWMELTRALDQLAEHRRITGRASA